MPDRGINDRKQITDVLTSKGYTGPWLFEVSFPDGQFTLEECKHIVCEWEDIFK